MIFHAAMTDKNLDPSTVLERICVRPPYFALADLSMSGSVLNATARAKTRIDNELGPMSAAELARHAAIAGSCVAAMAQNDQRQRYYLAQLAEGDVFASDAPFGAQVGFRAELLDLNKRQARARVRGEVGDELVVDCQITYTILTAETFQRLFSWRSLETPAVASPYGSLLNGPITRETGSLKLIIPKVPVSSCAGHFDGFPAMPISVLGGHLSDLAGRLLEPSGVAYRVVYANIEARDLVWAGERVEFAVSPSGESAGRYRVKGSVVAEERMVASMDLVLETVDKMLVP